MEDVTGGRDPRRRAPVAMQRDPELKRAIDARRRAQINRSAATYRRRRIAVGVGFLLVVGLGVVVVTSLGGDGDGDGPTEVAADPADFAVAAEPLRLFDSSGDGTFDGLPGPDVAVAADEEVRIEVASRVDGVDESSVVVVNVAVADPPEAGSAEVYACGGDRPDDPPLVFEADRPTAAQVITPVGDGGAICVRSDVEVAMAVDFAAVLPEDSFETRTAALLSADSSDSLVTGPLDPASPTRIPVGEEDLLDDDVSALLVTITTGSEVALTLSRCDTTPPATPTLESGTDVVTATEVVVPFSTADEAPATAPGEGTGDGSGDEPGEPALCVAADRAADVEIVLDGLVRTESLAVPDSPSRLLDTRADGTTVDGDFAAEGVRPATSTLQLAVAGRGGVPADASAILLRVRAIHLDEPGTIVVHGPTAETPRIGQLSTPAGSEEASATVIVPIGANGAVCLHNTAATHLTADALGWFLGGATASPAAPPAGATTSTPSSDATSSTLATSVPFGDESSAGDPEAAPTGSDAVGVAPTSVPSDPSDPSGATTVPPGAGSATDGTVAVEVTAGDCPAQELFPHWRMIAAYGTERSGKLGILGEQSPEEAVAVLEDIMEPWRVDERPLLGAFELITVLATAAPGDDGLYNLPASEEFVQNYLDAARRHGVYLILDLQTGRSDFLTEAKRYESFLREPDVGLALDPEWRTPPPDRPIGGQVGHVDAAEVNAVSAWLADIVAEEDLPEKLLVVHQFQEQMIRNKDQLIDRPGLALMIHMDGLGTRSQKLDTYSYVHAIEPLHNGVKLFYDEDIDMYEASDILGGVFQPIPDLITYQ